MRVLAKRRGERDVCWCLVSLSFGVIIVCSGLVVRSRNVLLFINGLRWAFTARQVGINANGRAGSSRKVAFGVCCRALSSAVAMVRDGENVISSTTAGMEGRSCGLSTDAGWIKVSVVLLHGWLPILRIQAVSRFAEFSLADDEPNDEDAQD